MNEEDWIGLDLHASCPIGVAGPNLTTDTDKCATLSEAERELCHADVHSGLWIWLDFL